MSDTPEVETARAWMSKHTAHELAAMARAGRKWTPAERHVLHGDTSDDFKNRDITHNDALVRMLDAGETMTKDAAKRARFIKRERAKGETYL